MKHFFILKEYIKYRFKARSAHGIHSPFVFDFIENVLKDDRHFYAFDEILNVYQDLQKNHTLLEVEDFGAGSHIQSNKHRKVSTIAKTAGRNAKLGQLLFRIAAYYQCQHILELGTSLGLGTSYLAAANLSASVITIEGSENIAKEAGKTFQKLGFTHIQQVVGQFDQVLPDIINSYPSFDLIFIDGNHRKEPTLDYFRLFLPKINDDTILIFDDIHWSPGMKEAWELICKDEKVTLTIDLFNIGLVFFRKECKVKQDFILKY